MSVLSCFHPPTFAGKVPKGENASQQENGQKREAGVKTPAGKSYPHRSATVGTQYYCR